MGATSTGEAGDERAIERAPASRGVTLSFGMTLLFSGEASARSLDERGPRSAARSAEFSSGQLLSVARALSGDARPSRRRPAVVQIRPMAPRFETLPIMQAMEGRRDEARNLDAPQGARSGCPATSWRRWVAQPGLGVARSPTPCGAADPPRRRISSSIPLGCGGMFALTRKRFAGRTALEGSGGAVVCRRSLIDAGLALVGHHEIGRRPAEVGGCKRRRSRGPISDEASDGRVRDRRRR